MKKVLIIGYGVVGRNLYKELEKLHPDIYDKFKTKVNTKRNIKYDFAFVCIDTPKMDTIDAPIDDLISAIQENDAAIYIIKSTILPNSTNKLIEITGKQIIFSPEYYGGTQHCNNYDFNFTILGGKKEICCEVIQLLQNCYDARHIFRITDSVTAELNKYMENSWLATKVSFCNQFNLIAQQLGVDYEELRELFILDPRVNPSHTFVYKDRPYWDSHCLNKDVPTIAKYSNAELLKAIIEFNEHCKRP